MYNLQNAEQVNFALSQLYKAEPEQLFTASGEELPRHKGIRVNETIVSVQNKNYQIVQHEQAFRPIIEGLTQMSVENFKFSLYGDKKRAYFNVYVGEGYDTIRFGFQCKNSFDGSLAITYGMKSNRLVSRVVELVGYRQICSNGMKVRVDLANAEFVREEERVQIENILTKKVRIRHFGNIDKINEKLDDVQYAVEAFMLLRNPLERIVRKAQNMHIEFARAKELIEKYVGRRRLDKILIQYGEEENTLFGVYNAITFYASHKVSNPVKGDSLLNKAATMLQEQLVTLPEIVR